MITGRRKELEFREVYLWQRKQLTHEEDEKAYEVAKGILDKEHVNETFLAETKPT